ncbi:thiamine phosphate synthase [Anaerobaca lacustris]|uniref:Thiamine-phosphate synthase n=1 Tax=Anaerobaca lacustris TaxID=3044600 RepID=A0AAW6U2D3_9BACT|nr:thiamine phosphate synthase [Sedimentisphaerales bacterium M17dextr]
MMDRAVYRIIDANFNRAREALRVMEEYCRFAVNNGSLSGRAKQLRHELCAAIGQLEQGKLLAGRDTLGDVGVGQRVENQLERATAAEAFTAGARRLTEALRALAEMVQAESKPVAAAIERLRYQAYTLEKDVVLFAGPVERFNRVQLYVIVTSDLPAEILSLASRCAAGGADCIQLRAKGMPDERLFAVAVEFVDICRDLGALSIVNDRIDIAAAAGADGVHLGQDDLPVEQARRLQLSPLIVGKSTHNDSELERAIGAMPSYVSLGPAFTTVTKPKIEVAGTDYIRHGLQRLAETGVSHVAIGGITHENVELLLRAGVQRVAVCAAVTEAPSPADACRRIKDKMAEFLSG